MQVDPVKCDFFGTVVTYLPLERMVVNQLNVVSVFLRHVVEFHCRHFSGPLFIVLGDLHKAQNETNLLSLFVFVLNLDKSWLRLNMVGIKRTIGIIRVVQFLRSAVPFILTLTYFLG